MPYTILILLSTYNGEKYIKEQIESLLAQSIVKVEILIRDDGSTDNTILILKNIESENSLVKVEYGKNVGCAESYRYLLNMAFKNNKRYDYYAFSDQDDVWLPNKLLSACERLKKKSNNIPLLYCSNLKVVDANLNVMGMKYAPDIKLVTKGESLVCSMATGCTMVFNHRTLEIFNLFPPKHMVIHDLWILHTCLFLGKVFYDSNAYILYRQHGHNVIGAKMTIGSQIKVKWRSIIHLFSEHENEEEAKELIKCYSSILSSDDMKLIRVLADYKKSWKYWWRLLVGGDKFAKEIHRQRHNWLFKIRVFLGCV